MLKQPFLRSGLLVALVLLAAGGFNSAFAQTRTVTTSDIQRLQDDIRDVENEIFGLPDTDRAAATRFQSELDDIRDEAIYLKVKLRKERAVTQAELSAVRNRLESLRTRVASRTGGTTGTAERPVTAPESPAAPEEVTSRAPQAGPNTVPINTEVDVRLQTALSSKTANVEDRFDATTVVDLMKGSRVLVPAGSTLRGVVTSVNKADRLDRKGSLTLAFDQITVGGRSYPIRATVVQALESEGIKGEAGRIGTGAGVGAIIGGILGGVKGALIGILVGAGGTMAATEGTDVELPAGTVLRIRLDTPLTVR